MKEPDPVRVGEGGAVQEGLERLVAFYEGLSPASLERVGEVYAPDARFKDPFNDVTGHVAIRQVFAHMFDNVEEPRFRVVNRVRQGDQAAPDGFRCALTGVSTVSFIQQRVKPHESNRVCFPLAYPCPYYGAFRAKSSCGCLLDYGNIRRIRRSLAHLQDHLKMHGVRAFLFAFHEFLSARLPQRRIRSLSDVCSASLRDCAESCAKSGFFVTCINWSTRGVGA